MNLLDTAPKHLDVYDTRFYPIRLTPTAYTVPTWEELSLVSPNLMHNGDYVLIADHCTLVRLHEDSVKKDFTIGLSLEVIQSLPNSAFPFLIRRYRTDSVRMYKILSPFFDKNGVLATIDEDGNMSFLNTEYLQQCTRG